ncbi:unnamed protein product [Echinostoma caproni]|uniref:RUN domain-containing protein n=1 Tax=Echinostoma caproni TaxID=27848 RepID=A0A183A852_9TREM|nr:unnamed protein product [Echinostoma caproni]
MMISDRSETGFVGSGTSSESFTFFGIRKARDNDTFRAKRRALLDELKKDVKRLMEEAATKNSLPENSSLVLSFCVNAESCLRFGLKNSSPHFYRELSVIELLQKIAPKCPEASVLLNYLSNHADRTKSGSIDKSIPPNNRSFLSILSPNKPAQSSGVKPLCYNNSTNPHWIHLALMEKLLQPMVCALFNEAKNLYQYGSIMTTNSDARIFLSLLSGPCSLNYTIPTLDDPYWSTLHADELLERHRFISLSTQAFYENQTCSAAWKREFKLRAANTFGAPLPAKRSTTPRVRSMERSPAHLNGQRFIFGLQQHSSTSSTSSANSGGMDGLYQPRRHQLLFAKNNVMLGSTDTNRGYLAVYCNLSGVNLRWTSNELLLHASSLLHRNMQLDDPNNSNDGLEAGDQNSPQGETGNPNQATVTKDSQASSEFKDLKQSNTSDGESQSNSNRLHKDEETFTKFHSSPPCCILNELPFRPYPSPRGLFNHCTDNLGVLIVFVASDGIQYPPIRLPGGWKSSLDFLSSIEMGLMPLVQMEPNTDSVRDLMMSTSKGSTGNSGSIFSRRFPFRSSGDASPGPSNPFKRFIDFCSLKPNAAQPLTSSDSITTSTTTTTPDLETQSETETNGSTAEISEVNTDSQKSPDLGHTPTNEEKHCLGQSEESCLESEAPDKPSTEYNLSSEIVFKLVRGEISPDSFSAKPTDTESPGPMGSHPGSISGDTDEPMDSLSDALDAIKCKLMANAFYAWLTHARYMKVIKTHLADSVRPGINWSRTPTTPLTILDASKWNQLFWNVPEECRKDFDATPIYEHIYQAGCEEDIRIQVWPYLLQVFDWSMTEGQKKQHSDQLKQHYQTTLSEWMQLEEQHIRDEFARVLESVQKDVIRCDRHHHFFHKIAPILALLLTTNQDPLDVEIQAYAFFASLMKVRLGKLYSSAMSSAQMDRNFASLRALVQVKMNLGKERFLG